MLLSHPNSNTLAPCNILPENSLDWVQKHWTLSFLTENTFIFPKQDISFLNTFVWLNTKLNSPIMSVFEFHNYLQEQRVGFSILLCTGLSQLPRGQWQILLASNKKIGQQWMVFTSHTPRFQILLARRHYSVLFLWRTGRGKQFLATGHILKPPNKYIFMLKLTLKENGIWIQ